MKIRLQDTDWKWYLSLKFEKRPQRRHKDRAVWPEKGRPFIKLQMAGGRKKREMPAGFRKMYLEKKKPDGFLSFQYLPRLIHSGCFKRFAKLVTSAAASAFMIVVMIAAASAFVIMIMAALAIAASANRIINDEFSVFQVNDDIFYCFFCIA